MKTNQTNGFRWLAVLVTWLIFAPIGSTYAAEVAGVLKAQFVYKDELRKNPLTAKCKAPEARIAGAAILTDIAVSLAGKLTESVIDAAAAKTQPEATTLETVIPLPGFYGAKDIAISDGCLVFHNGIDDKASQASIKAVLQVAPSPDLTAFRFTVREWQFQRFLKPTTTSWFQTSDIKDFVLKIEFLSPGSDGIGTRRVFVEHPFAAVDRETIANAFTPDQQLPWFSSPPRSSPDATDLNLPLNLKITLVETTKPNQFAAWLQEIAKEKKGDVATLVKDAVKRSLDPAYEATENAKQAEAAGTAYAAYKTAWDALAAQHAAKPADPPAGASSAAQAAHQAALKAWQAAIVVSGQTMEAKKVAAKVAFAAAHLPWPGDLPAVGG